MSSALKGSQGSVTPIVLDDGTLAMLKISTYVDHSVELEFDAMNIVAKLNLPHFCEPLGLITDTKRVNDRSIVCTKKIVGVSLSHFMKNANTPIDTKLNAIYQTMAAVTCMNRKTGICHNDLHTCNVIVTDTDVDVHVYVIKKSKTFAIETGGYRPVIIDFGLSFVPNTRMRMVPAFTNVGYFPFAFDPLMDVRVLMVDSAYILSNHNATDEDAIRFVTKSKTMWRSLDLDNSGHFVEGTFCKICDELKFFVAGHLSDTKHLGIFDVTNKDVFEEALSLFVANLRLPLKPIKSRQLKKQFIRIVLPIRVDSEYSDAMRAARSTFDVMLFHWNEIGLSKRAVDDQLAFVKRTLSANGDDMNSIRLKKRNDVCGFKRCASLLTGFINNHVVGLAKKMCKEKAQLYEKVSIKNTLNALESMDVKKPISFKIGQKIDVFDCDTNDHTSRILRDEADVDRYTALYAKNI